MYCILLSKERFNVTYPNIFLSSCHSGPTEFHRGSNSQFQNLLSNLNRLYNDYI